MASSSKLTSYLDPSDEEILQYCENLNACYNLLKDSGSDELSKNTAVRIFNEKYLQTMYGIYVPTKDETSTGMYRCHIDESAKSTRAYVDHILEFMLMEDVHGRLGFTFEQLFNMDVGLYDAVKTAIRKHTPKESREMKNLEKELKNLKGK